MHGRCCAVRPAHASRYAQTALLCKRRVVDGKSQVVVKGSTPKSNSSHALEEFSKHLEARPCPRFPSRALAVLPVSSRWRC